MLCLKRDEYGINSCEISFFRWWWREITDIAISNVCHYKTCNGKITKEAILTLRDEGDDEFEQTFLVCDKHFQIIRDWWLSQKK